MPAAQAFFHPAATAIRYCRRMPWLNGTGRRSIFLDFRDRFLRTLPFLVVLAAIQREKKMKEVQKSSTQPTLSSDSPKLARERVTEAATESGNSTSPDIASDEGLIKALQAAKVAGAAPQESVPVDETFMRQVGTRVQQLSQQTTLNDTARKQNTISGDANLTQIKDSEPAETDGELGRIGSYRIMRLVGQGGMGQVYEAEDTKLNRKVAIKVMQEGLANSDKHRARFLREAQLAAKVESDFVCPIYQIGEGSRSPFIAMPFLQGRNLESKLRENSLAIVETLTICIQIAKGLAAAHSLNLTHRDIKPSNIFLESRADKTERVRILDFGLARVDEADLALTSEGTIVGTPGYMSPEQARGETLDSRSDLFSFGVVLYEMLTGKQPFRGNTTTALISSLLVDKPQPPEALNPAIPRKLSQLVMQLLEKSPADRIQSADALADALEECLHRLSAEQTLELPRASERFSKQASPTVVDTHDPQPSPKLVKPRVTTPFAIGLAACGGIIVWLASILVFSTPNGTLIIEADDETDLRLKKGEIHIFDAEGKLAYKLAPSEKQKGIASGTYMVKVEGTDGVQLDTPRFEMKRNGQVIVRATAVDPSTPNPAGPNPVGQGLPGANAADSNMLGSKPSAQDSFGPSFFPGKLVIDQISPNIGTNLVSAEGSTGNGTAIMLHRANAKAEEIIGTKLISKLPSGAFAMRASLENARFYLNIRSRYRDNHARWLTLRYFNSNYLFSVHDHQLINGRWEFHPAKDYAVLELDSLKTKGPVAFQVCGRWSETDYDIWFNGKHLIGGEIEDTTLFQGVAGPLEFVIRAIENGETKLTIEELWVWDQSQLEPAKVFPPDLPRREKVLVLR